MRLSNVLARFREFTSIEPERARENFERRLKLARKTPSDENIRATYDAAPDAGLTDADVDRLLERQEEQSANEAYAESIDAGFIGQTAGALLRSKHEQIRVDKRETAVNARRQQRRRLLIERAEAGLKRALEGRKCESADIKDGYELLGQARRAEAPESGLLAAAALGRFAPAFGAGVNCGPQVKECIDIMRTARLDEWAASLPELFPGVRAPIERGIVLQHVAEE